MKKKKKKEEEKKKKEREKINQSKVLLNHSSQNGRDCREECEIVERLKTSATARTTSIGRY